ncbi:MAG: class I SAM-dependent DNA methyltransferase [Selenomonadaceae bacterium]|nr:class I SAM-dependent DNA methyltransferase [Selenomonadaceae bacterium]
MNDIDIAHVAKIFSMDWHERGYEKGETQKFWRALLKKIFGVDDPDKFIDFEVPVPQGYIDAYIPATKVLIEQKSFDVELDKSVLEQAMRYADALPADKKPRWIVTCNFQEFRVYNFTQNLFEPKQTIIRLRDLVYEYPRLRFLIDPTADESSTQELISLAALKDIDRIYKAFKSNYEKNKVRHFEDALNKLCTRLVFCLYAGDAKIFDNTQKTFDANDFFGYIAKFDDKKRVEALQKIFDVLSRDNHRRADLDDDLKIFPYVDGGLFDEKIPLPAYNKRITNPAATLRNVQGIRNFRWREISPPIFGAMFESKFSLREEQREHGVFYTSIENIHKVIDPLFLDDLRGELANIKRMHKRNRIAPLKSLQDKLASLNFLDPACGSGNFLTETFLSLRRLENEIIEELVHLYADLPEDPIKVSPRQFYGIEIDSFAVAVARLALSIADIQMKRETSWIINRDLPELPLIKYISVIAANATRLDWKSFAPEVNFIIGNPPYRGAREKSDEQADDINRVFTGWRNTGNLDYVACWYKKAADFMTGNQTRAALVATNSLCQGDSVGTLWKRLFAEGVHIDFAHRTFKWLSDSENQAHVHCIVVGFSTANNAKPKLLIDGNKVTVAENINAYLVDGENIFVESRPNHIQSGVPVIGIGNKPIDGGNYLFTPEEMEDFIRAEPAAAKYFRPWFGAEEFIKGKRRYCLLLKDLPLEEIKAMPLCWERVEAVRSYRLQSKSPGTRKLADKPTRFHVENFPHGQFLVMAKTSSGERKYIPMTFMNDSVLCSDKVFVLPNATLYHFGVLTSSIHMAWMRATNCPLGTSYSYSIAVVYNNFYWAEPSGRQRRRIEETAQEILKVRAAFADWTYAKLYDEATMPADLRDAHRENDLAVAIAYGFADIINDEAAIVARLMKEYKRLTS